jgi:molecular chaperone GrpE
MTRTKQKQKGGEASAKATTSQEAQKVTAKPAGTVEEAATTTEQTPDQKDVKNSTKKSETAVEEKVQPAPLSPAEETAIRIGTLEREIADLNDRLLRKIAEFDNYRKRTAREQFSLLESAAGPLMLKLLPILDDMEQLEKLAPEQATTEALLKGLTLIHQKVGDTLRKEGLELIPAAGKQFDPELHEVLAVMEDSEQKPGVILVEQQKGYRLKGRILRHSRVVINKDEE